MNGETAFDEADLHGLVDGRIEPSRAAALAASLRSDPEASARVDAWRRQTDSLRTLFSSVLCEPVPVRLLPIAVAVRDEACKRPPPPAPPMRRLVGVVATTAIGAALVGFALGALASLGTDGFGLAPPAARDTGGAEPKARSFAARAAEAHRTFFPNPRQPAGSAGTSAGIAPAIAAARESAGLAHPAGHRPHGGLRAPDLPVLDLRAPDLARQGWTFAGARVVPGRRGPATFLSYDEGADHLGLLVSRDPDGDGPGGSAAAPARVTAADDGEGAPLGVATWTDAGTAYALTSDRGREWLARSLAPLRDAVRAQMRAADGEDPAP